MELAAVAQDRFFIAIQGIFTMSVLHPSRGWLEARSGHTCVNSCPSFKETEGEACALEAERKPNLRDEQGSTSKVQEP
jgi:hypothetical protein